MKFFLAVFTFINAAMADKPVSHSPKDVSQTRPADRDIELVQTPEEREILEVAIEELNSFGPTRKIGESELPSQPQVGNP